MFHPGFDIRADIETMNFVFGADVFGPITEKRRLDDIRKSLKDPASVGPEIVYSVSMDVGKKAHREDLIRRNLLYGAMIYAGGRMGNEPVRSQGHVHALSASCGASTPEVYEIWSGRAAIFMQQSAGDDAGDCYVIEAGPGDVVIVPEGWAHCTVNVSERESMTFGAWCVRDYGFDYTDIRAHGGVAFFPAFSHSGNLYWEANPRYVSARLQSIPVPDYKALGIVKGVPIYTQYENNPELFMFVANPVKFAEKSKLYLPKGV